MSRRSKPKSQSADKRKFTHTAMRVHKRNIPRNPMRGGIRL